MICLLENILLFAGENNQYINKLFVRMFCRKSCGIVILIFSIQLHFKEQYNI